jgi:hypothetical protein
VSGSAWREALTLGIEIHKDVGVSRMVCDLDLVQKVGSLATNRTCNCRYLRLLQVKGQRRHAAGLVCVRE